MKEKMMKVDMASHHGRELAGKWFYQIISFWRIDDADGFMGENLGRNWISREEEHVRYFIIYTGDILIAHAEVLSKDIEHEGIEYRIYGLGGVMTYPAFGVLFATTFLREIPTIYQLCGLVFVILGVFTVVRKKKAVLSELG